MDQCNLCRGCFGEDEVRVEEEGEEGWKQGGWGGEKMFHVPCDVLLYCCAGLKLSAK